jgi:hypothetical protein
LGISIPTKLYIMSDLLPRGVCNPYRFFLSSESEGVWCGLGGLAFYRAGRKM